MRTPDITSIEGLGIQQGIQQERTLGLQREHTLLSRLAERRFDSNTAQRLRIVLENNADPLCLGKIGEWIIDCESDDEPG